MDWKVLCAVNKIRYVDFKASLVGSHSQERFIGRPFLGFEADARHLLDHQVFLIVC